MYKDFIEVMIIFTLNDRNILKQFIALANKKIILHSSMNFTDLLMCNTDVQYIKHCKVGREPWSRGRGWLIFLKKRKKTLQSIHEMIFFTSCVQGKNKAAINLTHIFC